MSDPPELQGKTPAPTSSLSIISLIIGFVGWILIPITGEISTVITGHTAKKEIRESRGLLSSDGLATARLVLGYSNLALGLCGFLTLMLFPALLTGLLAYGNQIFHTVPYRS